MPKEFKITFTSQELLALNELLDCGLHIVHRVSLRQGGSLSKALLITIKSKIEGTDDLSMDTPLHLAVATKEVGHDLQVPELATQIALFEKYAAAKVREVRTITNEYLG